MVTMRPHFFFKNTGCSRTMCDATTFFYSTILCVKYHVEPTRTVWHGHPALVARVLITVLSNGCDLGSLKRRSQVPVTLALLGLSIWLYLLLLFVQTTSRHFSRLSPLILRDAENHQKEVEGVAAKSTHETSARWHHRAVAISMPESSTRKFASAFAGYSLFGTDKRPTIVTMVNFNRSTSASQAHAQQYEHVLWNSHGRIQPDRTQQYKRHLGR